MTEHIYALKQLEPIVRCPSTKEPLRVLLPSDFGKFHTVPKKAMESNIEAAFVNDSGTCWYLVSDGICDFREHSVSGDETPALTRTQAGLQVSNDVAKWYDEFGWQVGGSGRYKDSEFFSQNTDTSYGLYESLSHHDQRMWFAGSGKFFLDAASGAIAHREYLAYSETKEFRVCVDFSRTALLEAKQKLRQHGIYVLANVCALPFIDDSFHGVMSGYTVQHIHGDEQKLAISELYRVLSPEHSLCIMATQEVSRLHQRIYRIFRRFNPAKKSEDAGLRDGSDRPGPPFQLYGSIRNYAWWAGFVKELCPNSEIHTLRLWSQHEYLRCRVSMRSLRILRALETLWSKQIAPHADLISAVLTKPRISVDGD